LFQLQRDVAKRLKTLKALAIGGITSKGTIDRASEESTHEWITHVGLDGEKFDITYEVKRHTSVERWGVVRYNVPESVQRRILNMSTDERMWVSFQTLYGLYWKNPASLWELIPWSWLIDWIVPIQDFLRRYSTGLELEAKEACIMTRSTTTFSAKAISVSGSNSLDLSDLAFSGTRVSKERYYTADPELLPSLPNKIGVLNQHQAGILWSFFFLVNSKLWRRYGVKGPKRRL
jgi:hypothetical protein